MSPRQTLNVLVEEDAAVARRRIPISAIRFTSGRGSSDGAEYVPVLIEHEVKQNGLKVPDWRQSNLQLDVASRRHQTNSVADRTRSGADQSAGEVIHVWSSRGQNVHIAGLITPARKRAPMCRPASAERTQKTEVQQPMATGGKQGLLPPKTNARHYHGILANPRTELASDGDRQRLQPRPGPRCAAG
jgi:hypothetical protein